MAIRMPKKGGGIDISKVEAEIMKALDREVDSYAHRLATAAKKAVIQSRRESIVEWYMNNGLSSASSIVGAVEAETSFHRVSRSRLLIEITSYMNSSVLDSTSSFFPSAQSWVSKHGDTASPYSPGSYVFFLRWETGALALPERAHFTGSGWVNNNFMFSSCGTLREYTIKKLSQDVTSLIPGLMRGRNTRMGAGINSTGRDAGLANLGSGRGGK